MVQYRISHDFVNPELEQGLIAAIAQTPTMYLEVMSHCAVEAFAAYYDKFEEVGTAIENGQEIPSIAEWTPVVDPINAAQQLNNLHQYRMLCDALQAGIEQVREKTDDPALAHIDRLETKLTDIIQFAQDQKREKLENIEDIFPEALRDLQERFHIIQNTDRNVIGIETGVSSHLDEMLGGLCPGLITLTARPSLGKTSLGIQIALSACRQGIPVLFISLEEPKHRLSVRAVASASRMHSKGFFDGRDNPESLQAGFNEIREQLRLFHIIEGHSRLSFAHIRARAHQLIYRFGTNRDDMKHRKLLVVVDYLQKQARMAKGTRDGDFRFDVGQIASTYRDLAVNDLKCPILLLSAQNRMSGGRAGNDTIAESDQVAFDMDVAMFLSENTEQASEEGSVTDLTLSKNRWGPTGKVTLVFNKALGEFRELDLHDYELAYD